MRASIDYIKRDNSPVTPSIKNKAMKKLFAGLACILLLALLLW